MKRSVGRWVRVATAIGVVLTTIAGTAVAAGATEASTTEAAPEATTKNTTVLLVHGFDGGDLNPSVLDLPLDSKTECTKGAMKTWRDGMLARGWTDVRTIGYYKGDNCMLGIPTASRSDNTINTSIDELGKEFAWLVWNNFTRLNRPVSISAHSMGGLVTRRALAGVQNREPGFPPGMLVRDVVTSGTPHNGAQMAGLCPARVITQCQEMKAGSTFLANLSANPQGRTAFGATSPTDWSLIGSNCDDVATGTSATTMGLGGPGRPAIFKRIFLAPSLIVGGCLNPAGLDHTETATDPQALNQISTSLFTDA